jgi:hypothetical protein
MADGLGLAWIPRPNLGSSAVPLGVNPASAVPMGIDDLPPITSRDAYMKLFNHNLRRRLCDTVLGHSLTIIPESRHRGVEPGRVRRVAASEKCCMTA